MQNAEVDFANDILVVGDDARMFDELYENFLPEVFIFHLKSFTVIAANHITRLNAGYSKEQSGNKIPANLEQEFDLKTLQNLRDSLLRGECGHTLFSTYICYKDGVSYPADTNLRLFSYEEGEYRRAMVFDLSKCEQLESEIEENETTLNAVLNVARDAVVMLNCDG